MWKSAVQQAKPSAQRPPITSHESADKLAQFNPAPVNRSYNVFTGMTFWIHLVFGQDQDERFRLVNQDRGGQAVSDPEDPTITHMVLNIPGHFEPGTTFSDEDLTHPGSFPEPKWKLLTRKYAKFWNCDSGEPDTKRNEARQRKVYRLEWLEEVLAGTLKASDDGDWAVWRRSYGPLERPDFAKVSLVKTPLPKVAVDPRSRPVSVDPRQPSPPVTITGTAQTADGSSSTSTTIPAGSSSTSTTTPAIPELSKLDSSDDITEGSSSKTTTSESAKSADSVSVTRPSCPVTRPGISIVSTVECGNDEPHIMDVIEAVLPKREESPVETASHGRDSDTMSVSSCESSELSDPPPSPSEAPPFPEQSDDIDPSSPPPHVAKVHSPKRDLEERADPACKKARRSLDSLISGGFSEVPSSSFMPHTLSSRAVSNPQRMAAASSVRVVSSSTSKTGTAALSSSSNAFAIPKAKNVVKATTFGFAKFSKASATFTPQRKAEVEVEAAAETAKHPDAKGQELFSGSTPDALGGPSLSKPSKLWECPRLVPLDPSFDPTPLASTPLDSLLAQVYREWKSNEALNALLKYPADRGQFLAMVANWTYGQNAEGGPAGDRPDRV